MKLQAFKKTVILFTLFSAFGLAQAAKPPHAGNGNSPDVGDEAQIQGQIIRTWSYVTESGSKISRFLISRPTIDGTIVRSAYLSGCTGPTVEQCRSSGFEMVSIEPGVALGSTINSYGLITTISKKRYYSTYYMNATTEILQDF